MNVLNASHLQQRLHEASILPTLQRMAVASVLLGRPVHMTAEQVLDAARRQLPSLSRATVYAVLQLFVRSRLLKELPIDGASTVYDSNTEPHHHLYDIDTGAVADLSATQLQVLGVPEAVGGMQLVGVDVIVRVRGLVQDSVSMR
ncbi:Fur family transcriptional regulator [Sphaerotilus sp.]|uniref:Fur family transcriptional regulator n=1 Tax=Sphaerotilus sp. TaxID=2093942 RepID=UPI002ACDBDD7|nr:Fur family transcriptional regulator [Sphaerotilus sp.]MDZ7857240.1 Fur family transcriptional regulator [Sphaerotilus sp.]